MNCLSFTKLVKRDWAREHLKAVSFLVLYCPFVMDRVKRNIYFLRYLSTLVNSVQRKSLLETASADQITALAEIAYNILGGIYELTDSELSSLIRKLASRHFQVDEKRTALLGNTIAVKHLLTVFFNHNGPLKYGLRRYQTANRYTSDTVPTADSESEEDDDNNNNDAA